MAVTMFDSKTALMVIDLQNGILAFPTAHPVDEVVKHASALSDAFRSHREPVVLVTVGGAPSGPDGTGSQRRTASRRMGRSRPRAEPAAGRPLGDEAAVGSVHEYVPR
jgi:nicotinamidase-related amidase